MCTGAVAEARRPAQYLVRGVPDEALLRKVSQPSHLDQTVLCCEECYVLGITRFSSIYDLYTLDACFLFWGFFFCFFFFVFFFWLPRMACGALPCMILVPEPGTESMAVAVNVRSSNHGTNRDVSLHTRC